MLRVLTDRGTEYCGSKEQHEYQLYLAVENIDHSKTKAKSPQTNGLCERFDRTIQDEFYAIAFGKKVYRTIQELQTDLDRWMNYYNQDRTHTGKYCFGKTPMQTFRDSIPLAKEKLIERLTEDQFVAYPPLSHPGEGKPQSGSDEFEEMFLYSKSSSDTF